MSENDVPVASQSEEEAQQSAAQGASNSGSHEVDAEELARLDEALAKFTEQKRWSDVIKTTIAKAELVVDPQEKAELWAQAGRLYLERSSNQAEAIKCFAAVLELEPSNQEAIDRLKEMYEKRRDWERLIEVMKLEGEGFDPDARLGRLVEVAELATERLRKPAICIELWQNVLEQEGYHEGALAALAGLYERAREWEPLADVLERQSEQGQPDDQQAALLTKLGGVYADKLNNDDAAVAAYLRLLTIRPDDRRAQDQIKKRYVARRDWDALEDFYAPLDKWEELIRTLEREAGSDSTELEERIALLFRVARLWDQHVGKPERAAKAYESILALDESNVQAVDALAPIYEQAGDARKLVAVNEKRLAHLTDVHAQVALLRQNASLYIEKLRAARQAFECLLSAFALDSRDMEIREQLEEVVGRDSTSWENLLEGYAAAVEQATDDEHACDLRRHFGRLLTQRDLIDDAIAQYEAVLELRPDDIQSMDALLDLYERSKRPAQLLATLKKRFDAEVDAGIRHDLAYRIAALQREELADVEGAIEAYRGIILEFGEGETQAYEALEALYSQQKRWDDLAETLEHRIDVGGVDDEVLCGFRYRLAQTCIDHLGDRPRAVELLREVLTVAPDHEQALSALEALLSDETLGGEVAAFLEPTYEQRGDYKRLVAALEVLVKFATDPENRVELLRRIGDVQAGHLGDMKGAFEASVNAVRALPDQPELCERLEELGTSQERLPDVVSLYSELAEKAASDDPVLARRFYLACARIQDQELNDSRGAVTSYMRALTLDEADIEVLELLEDLHRRTENWSALVEVLRRRLAQEVDVEAQENLLLQIAFLHAEMLSDAPTAIAVYAEVLEVNPASANALIQLDGLYEAQSMWAELADNLSRRLTLVETDDERASLMLRLAALRETKMGAVENAIEIYHEILEANPGQEQALAALERILQQPEHQLVVADALEPIYISLGAYEKLANVYEIQLSHSRSVERRVELLHRIAELYESSLQSVPAAFESQARALAEEPGNPDTQQELERLAEALSAWEPLAKVYEEQARATEDVSLSASLHTKAADIFEHNVGDQERAIEHYKRVVELDEHNLDAAIALERLYQGGEQFAELASVYLIKGRILDSVEEKRDQLFRAAAIYEEVLGQPTQAISVYEQALELEPDDIVALDKLISLQLAQQNWEALLGLYGQKVDVVDDIEQKKSIYVQIGAVQEQHLQQPARAIEVYQRILELDPEDLVAIARLDALYLAAEDWEELLGVLEREVDLAVDPADSVAFKYRVAELYEKRLDDAFRAVEVYGEVLEAFPEHEASRDALERMIAAGKEPVAAAQVLEPIYRATNDAARLVAVLGVLAKHDTDPLRRVDLLHQIADLYESQLEQPKAAFDAYAQALAEDPDNEVTLESLERLAESLQAFGELASLYDAQVKRLQSDSPETATDLALRLAAIYEVRVGDVDNAIARYAFVAEQDPTHVQSLAALDRLYEATGRYSELVEVIRKEILAAASPDEEIDLQYRLGHVLQSHLGDLEGALQQYREILLANPEHAAAVGALEAMVAAGTQVTAAAEILEPLYRAQEAWGKLLSLADVQLQALTSTEERSALMQRVADIAEERAGDFDAALSWMLRALREEPDSEHVVREAERLAEATGGWGQFADVLAQVVDGAADIAVAVSLCKMLASIYEEHLGDIERAEATYRFACGKDATDEDVLTALERIYTEHGAGEALVSVLRMRVGVAADPIDKVELSYRLANVLYNEVGRSEEAVGVLTGILDNMDAEHEPTIKSLQNIYAATGNWLALYDACERELKIALGDIAQSEILGRMAHLAAEELGKPNKAIELLRQILDLIGEDPAALNALGNLYAIQENWSDLVDVLEREVVAASEDDMRVAIHHDLGRVWYEKLGRDRTAIESWERALDIDPGDTKALFSIASVHRTNESYSDLVDTLHRIVDVGASTLDEARLEGVVMELASLYAEKLDQPQEAAEQYRQVLDINPRNFGAMDALERIYSAEERWEERIEIMQRRVDALDDALMKVAVLLDMATCWETMVEEPDGARSAYEQILALDPKHVMAFEKLEELHRAAKRFDELVEQCIVRLEGTAEQSARVKLLSKVAQIYEKDMGDRNQAFDALLLAWQEDFTNDESAHALERMAGLTQRWNELLTSANEALQVLQQQAPDDIVSQNAICVQCARWYGHEGHPDYAIQYLQQVLSVDPVNRPAMLQMAELHKQTQQWQAYAQLLNRLADMTEEPAEKAEAYVKMGELQESHFAAYDQAIGYYNAALAAVPNSDDALEALARIYQGLEEWAELVNVLGLRIAALEDVESITRAKLQLASVYEENLGDLKKAVDQYRNVLGDDPENMDALKGLERIYAQTEQWQELLKILERQLEITTNVRDQVELFVRIGGMWEEEFLKPERAIEYLERAVDTDAGNQMALRGLARLYRGQKKWHELIDTLERELEVVTGVEDKAALHAQIGAVYHRELKDLDRAVESYLSVTDVLPDDKEALTALATLYEANEDYSRAIDTMERLVVLVDDDETRVDLLYRMGQIFDKRMEDRPSAIECYRRATDIDGTHLPSLQAMRDIHLDEGAFHAAVRVLERAAEAETVARKEAVLRVEMARIYELKLNEHEVAIQAFERALALDSDSVDAALPLVDEYMSTERYQEAEPLLQMLVRDGGKFPTDEQHRLWLVFGECADHLKDDAKSIRAYLKATELDPQDLKSVMGLAAAYYRAQEWDNAFKYYQMVLVHHRDELGATDTTETLYRLGVIKRELGDRRKAVNMFEKALEEDPQHLPSLAAMVDIHEKQREWDQVVHFKKRILECTDDPDDRFRLYTEVGELWDEKLKNPAAAIDAYVEATAMQPDDHRVLHKLLALYMKSAQWESVVDTISRISEVDSRPEVRAKNAYTIGVILRDELKNPQAALEQFNIALDGDVSGQLKAFEAINKILTQQKNWKELERAYRKMLRRVTGSGDNQLEFNLWHSLGVIYRDRLRDLTAASEAFGMASRLQPDNMQEHQILAELYAMVPGRTQDAISEQQILLKDNPSDPHAYRALYKLYFDARAYDKAWCVAATLNFLQRADGEQKQFYEQYRTDGPIRPRSRLTDELWVKELFHPEEDFVVGKLFESVASAMLQWRAVSDKRLGLNKNQEVTDMANTTIALARTFGFVTQVFGLPILPRLFVCPDRAMGIDYAPTIPPASVCGNALLSGMSPLDAIFVVARHLAYYRGEHYIRTMLHTKDELKAVLAASMRIVGADISDASVEATATEIRSRMQPGQLEVLSKVGKRFIDAGARADLKVWMRSVEFTAARAGLLMCNDLGIAARLIQALPPLGTVEVSNKERVEDLILFSVSENYFRLREALGIALSAG